ncbi:MAG: glycosyltransferase family 4 protein [Anaerosomatales bacterium]|nr:glycosyltransferase family 4 protein [Anaerosomatales bacterium]
MLGPTPRHSVLFANNFPGPTLGGGEVHLMHLIRGAIAAEWQVSVAAAKGSALAGDTRAVGADVFELEYSRARMPTKPGLLRDIAAAYDADVIVGTGFLTNMLVRRAAAGLEGTAVVNIVHTEPDAARHEGSGPLRLGMRRRVDASSRDRVDRFVAISSAVRNAICAGGVEPERVVTIPNGIDIATVRSDAGLPAPEGLRAAGPLVGCVGRLAPVKGVEYFVRMAGPLGFQVPRARFVIAGSGPEESRLRAIAYAYGLGDRLVFLGHVSPVAPVLAACDVVVIPSLSEGFALVAAEAMALGKPVVGTNVGGLVDVVADGETGILVPPADPEALAAAVARLLHDPALSIRMGEAGAARAEERFTVERMVRDHLALFEELAASGAHGASSG